MDNNNVNFDVLQSTMNALQKEIEKSNLARKEILSLREAAQYMDIAESTLYKKCSAREVPFYKYGKLTYFKRAELDGLMTANPVPTMADIEQQAVSYCVCRTKNGRAAV